AVRELGLERRETVDIRAVCKFGYMLETPRILRYELSVTGVSYPRGMSRENASGAVNQQERLDAYLAGFVDGEGSFHVAVCRSSTTRAGFQLVPEFHVSQSPERRQVLDLLLARFGCGRIQENHRGSRDTTLVFVVRRRRDLLTQVIPFFETNPLLSSKHQEFVTFASIVRAMEAGEHLVPSGFEALKARALTMNGGGRYRRVHRG
ncbi:MAG: LAGLIDADG family homing endonuclease, partial [Acidimicrobiia bacterium]